MPLLTILWANKELVAKCLGIAAVIGLLWWFGWHVPAAYKREQARTAELTRQVELRDSAIELQGVIRREHEKITREENENLRRIRTGPKPGRTGYLVLPGLLPDLYENSPADGTTTGTAGS